MLKRLRDWRSHEAFRSSCQILRSLCVGHKLVRNFPHLKLKHRTVSARRSIVSSPVVAMAFKNVEVKEADALRKAQTYVDVRTAEEYAAGHVPGAVNVPVFLKGAAGMSPNPNFVSEFSAKFPKKDVQVLVGCQAGKRSEAACQQLDKVGYTGLTNVLGGYAAWVGAGLPTEK